MKRKINGTSFDTDLQSVVWEVFNDTDTEEFEFTDYPSWGDIYDAAREWAEEGDWGSGRVGLDLTISLMVDGEEIDSDVLTIDVGEDEEPDSDCDHQWETDPDDDFDGVRGVGGTGIEVHEECAKCGWLKVTLHRGSQRNPGEAETSTRYYDNEGYEQTA